MGDLKVNSFVKFTGFPVIYRITNYKITKIVPYIFAAVIEAKSYANRHAIFDAS